MEDKKLYYLFELSFVIVFSVALLLKTTQLVSTLEASLLLVVSFLLGIVGVYYGYKYKKTDFPKQDEHPKQDEQNSLKGNKKIPLDANVLKTFRHGAIIAFFTLILMGMIFAGLSHYSNSQWPEPKIPEPLIITFAYTDDRGEFSNWNVTSLDPSRGLGVQTNTKTEINYSVSAVAFEENSNIDRLTNVKLGCDYVSSNITFSNAQGQPQDIPFEIDIGTMELGDTEAFSGFLEVPCYNPNMYKMDWHISSDQTSHSFVVYVNAPPDAENGSS